MMAAVDIPAPASSNSCSLRAESCSVRQDIVCSIAEASAWSGLCARSRRTLAA